MTYKLQKLAPGAYDVIRNGEVVAALVRTCTATETTWTAELLECLPPEQLPNPFASLEHDFESLQDAKRWLGVEA